MTDAKLLPGFAEQFADVRGTRLRYYVGGVGSPIVLVHGLGGAAANWTELAPRLARTRRVLIPELPGHGGSSPLPAAPNLAAYADRVGLLAERESFLPAPVVGHSLGGIVALRLALRRPQDVTAVVLAAAAGISSSTRRAEYALRIAALLQPGKRIARYRERIARSPRLRAVVFARWGAADSLAFAPRAAEGFLTGPELHTDTRSAARALVLDDPRQDLGDLRCPCLVLWGAADGQLGLGDAFDYARRLHARLRVIPDCGHLLIGERPDECAHAIEDFLGA